MIKFEYCPIRGLVNTVFEKPKYIIEAEKSTKRRAKYNKRDKYGRFTK